MAEDKKDLPGREDLLEEIRNLSSSIKEAFESLKGFQKEIFLSVGLLGEAANNIYESVRELNQAVKTLSERIVEIPVKSKKLSEVTEETNRLIKEILKSPITKTWYPHYFEVKKDLDALIGELKEVFSEEGESFESWKKSIEAILNKYSKVLEYLPWDLRKTLLEITEMASEAPELREKKDWVKDLLESWKSFLEKGKGLREIWKKEKSQDVENTIIQFFENVTDVLRKLGGGVSGKFLQTIINQIIEGLSLEDIRKRLLMQMELIARGESIKKKEFVEALTQYIRVLKIGISETKKSAPEIALAFGEMLKSLFKDLGDIAKKDLGAFLEVITEGKEEYKKIVDKIKEAEKAVYFEPEKAKELLETISTKEWKKLFKEIEDFISQLDLTEEQMKLLKERLKEAIEAKEDELGLERKRIWYYKKSLEILEDFEGMTDALSRAFTPWLFIGRGAGNIVEFIRFLGSEEFKERNRKLRKEWEEFNKGLEKLRGSFGSIIDWFRKKIFRIKSEEEKKIEERKAPEKLKEKKEVEVSEEEKKVEEKERKESFLEELVRKWKEEWVKFFKEEIENFKRSWEEFKSEVLEKIISIIKIPKEKMALPKPKIEVPKPETKEDFWMESLLGQLTEKESRPDFLRSLFMRLFRRMGEGRLWRLLSNIERFFQISIHRGLAIGKPPERERAEVAKKEGFDWKKLGDLLKKGGGLFNQILQAAGLGFLLAKLKAILGAIWGVISSLGPVLSYVAPIVGTSIAGSLLVEGLAAPVAKAVGMKSYKGPFWWLIGWAVNLFNWTSELMNRGEKLVKSQMDYEKNLKLMSSAQRKLFDRLKELSEKKARGEISLEEYKESLRKIREEYGREKGEKTPPIKIPSTISLSREEKSHLSNLSLLKSMDSTLKDINKSLKEKPKTGESEEIRRLNRFGK